MWGKAGEKGKRGGGELGHKMVRFIHNNNMNKYEAQLIYYRLPRPRRSSCANKGDVTLVSIACHGGDSQEAKEINSKGARPLLSGVPALMPSSTQA